jgi:hypothetical protein
MSDAADTHTIRCLRCGRTLRAATSVKASYGPTCRARIRAAALAQALTDFTANQVDKARELITDGGLIPTNREGVRRPPWCQLQCSPTASTYTQDAARASI